MKKNLFVSFLLFFIIPLYGADVFQDSRITMYSEKNEIFHLDFNNFPSPHKPEKTFGKYFEESCKKKETHFEITVIRYTDCQGREVEKIVPSESLKDYTEKNNLPKNKSVTVYTHQINYYAYQAAQQAASYYAYQAAQQAASYYAYQAQNHQRN